MASFEQSTIWQKTLAIKVTDDPYTKERELLRTEFEKFREKAKILAGEINRDLPDFTVHDIDHIDALWSMADLVVGNEYELTPTEAFVLGGAFLIHDLGMGLAAYPEGLSELKKGPMWSDSVVFYYKEKLQRMPTPEEIENPLENIEKLAKAEVLRLLHAKHAERLTTIEWKDSIKGEPFYLIENRYLKEAYGSIIGLIAHSHWWKTDELPKKFHTILGAPGTFPAAWQVDPLKIACILRVADATNIDDRRAPSFLKTLRKISGYSEQHWTFQQKLYQPRIENDRLIYTSKSGFTKSECESWWLCYDTLKMIDYELKNVDSILSDNNKQRLKAIGVTGIDDIDKLSKLIKTEEWEPVDVQIRVNNVAKLVLNLGGFQLYGNDYSTPIRELVQNAADAIRARRSIDNDPEHGDIIITLGNDEKGDYISVEDNGVGMSTRVLTGPFLDFGQSFWSSTLLNEEFPGLQTKGFKSIGKFGIGFFSIFMLGTNISVYTRRYDAGRDQTLCLEFPEGVKSRPILRKANIDEQLKDGGTKVKVYCSKNVTQLLLKEAKTLSHLSKYLFPTLDINLYTVEGTKKNKAIAANDWLTISAKEITIRNIKHHIDYIKSGLPEIADDEFDFVYNEKNELIGRLAYYKSIYIELTINTFASIHASIVVDGIRSDYFTGCIGFINGEINNASRKSANPLFTTDALYDWLEKQYNKINSLLQSNYTLTQVLPFMALGIGKYQCPFAIHNNKMCNYDELIETISNIKTDIYVIRHLPGMYYSGGHVKVELYSNVIRLPETYYYDFENSDRSIKLFPHYDCIDILLEVCAKAWNTDIQQLKENFELDNKGTDHLYRIGTLENVKEIEDNAQIIKFPSSKS